MVYLGQNKGWGQEFKGFSWSSELNLILIEQMEGFVSVAADSSARRYNDGSYTFYKTTGININGGRNLI